MICSKDYSPFSKKIYGTLVTCRFVDLKDSPILIEWFPAFPENKIRSRRYRGEFNGAISIKSPKQLKGLW